jgi:hypothetical protein
VASAGIMQAFVIGASHCVSNMTPAQLQETSKKTNLLRRK